MKGDMTIKIHADKEPWTNYIQLRYGHKTEGIGWQVASPLVLKPISKDEFIEPFLVLSPELAQKLFDELYNCGLRASKEVGSAGQLDAIKYHLEDMRKLVFRG